MSELRSELANALLHETLHSNSHSVCLSLPLSCSLPAYIYTERERLFPIICIERDISHGLNMLFILVNIIGQYSTKTTNQTVEIVTYIWVTRGIIAMHIIKTRSSQINGMDENWCRDKYPKCLRIIGKIILGLFIDSHLMVCVILLLDISQLFCPVYTLFLKP